MKTLTNVGSLLASETIDGLARAVVITRTDGEKIGIAEGVAPTVSGVTFTENVLIETGSITMTANDSAARVDIKIATGGTAVLLADVQDGLYEGASVELMLYNRASPSGADTIYWGDVGVVRYTNLDCLQIQVNGPASRLKNWVTELYGPTCRAFFTDARCGIDPATVTETGTVTAVTNGRLIGVSGVTGTEDFFKLGLLTMTSGALTGRRREVRGSSSGLIELYASFGRDPEVGDTFTVRRGCSYDLSETTGCRFYDNVLNFRGEPWLDEDAARAVTGVTGTDPLAATLVWLGGFEGGIFDEAQGTDVDVYGGAAAGGTGKFGSGALVLDGAGDYIGPTTDNTQWYLRDYQWTFEAWVNITGSGDQCIISSWHDNITGYRTFRFGYYPTALGGLAFQYRNGLTGSFHSCVGSWSPSAGWHHVAVDHDSHHQLRVYADGVRLNVHTTPTPVLIGYPQSPCLIGAEYGTPSTNLFQGMIDEFRFSKGVARYGSDSGYTVPTTAFPRP